MFSATELVAKGNKLKQTETVVTDRSGMKKIVNPDGSEVLLTQTAGFVVDTKPDPVVAKVMDCLFVGSQDAASNFEGMKACNVTHVLNLVEGIVPAHPNEFSYKTLPILDVEDQPLSESLEKCFLFIDESIKQGGGCLVHCNAGVSRSCSVVLAYRLTKETQLTLKDALSQLKETRPAAKPNAGFQKQLEAMFGNR